MTVPEAPLAVYTLGTTGRRTSIDSAWVVDWAVGWLASVTLTVKLDVWAVVGVPVIAPVEAFSDSPAGSVPELRDQWYGGAPPVAPRVCAYAVPVVAAGREAVEIPSSGGLIASPRTLRRPVCEPPTEANGA